MPPLTSFPEQATLVSSRIDRKRRDILYSVELSAGENVVNCGGRWPARVDVGVEEREVRCDAHLVAPYGECRCSIEPVFVSRSHSRKGIPSAHMHWDSISDLATLGMWADPGSYAWYVGGPQYLPPS